MSTETILNDLNLKHDDVDERDEEEEEEVDEEEDNYECEYCPLCVTKTQFGTIENIIDKYKNEMSNGDYLLLLNTVKKVYDDLTSLQNHYYDFKINE